MTTLTDHPAKSLLAFSLGNCLGFLQSCPVEVRVLFIAAMVSVCLSLGTMIEHQHGKLDDRAMLSALLAAGGMPLIYSPPALCTSTRAPARLDEAAIGHWFKASIEREALTRKESLIATGVRHFTFTNSLLPLRSVTCIVSAQALNRSRYSGCAPPHPSRKSQISASASFNTP